MQADLTATLVEVLLHSEQLPLRTLAALRQTCKAFHEKITGSLPSSYRLNIKGADGHQVRSPAGQTQ